MHTVLYVHVPFVSRVLCVKGHLHAGSFVHTVLYVHVPFVSRVLCVKGHLHAGSFVHSFLCHCPLVTREVGSFVCNCKVLCVQDSLHVYVSSLYYCSSL